MDKKITLTPLLDRLIVKPNKASETTASGLYLPPSAKKKSKIGVIVAVGKGKPNEPMLVAVGQKIMYGEYGGTEIELNGEKHLMMRMSDVYGTIA